MPSALEQSLFRTLAYCAYNDFTVTSLELWKWCDAPETSVAEIESALTSSTWLKEQGLQTSSGFFGLGDVAIWRQERVHRVTDALRKSRRANRFVRFAAWLPWVRMVAICNSLAHSFTNERSDIDLFIVTQRGRIWSTRLMLTGILSILRLRPGEAKRDPICLSFFAAEDALDLSSMKIGAEDPYLAMWLESLTPIIDRDEILAKLHATNRWIRPSLPHAQPIERASAYRITARRSLPDLPFLERFAERLQRARFPQKLRSMMNMDTRVIVTDSVLKFHDNDRRQAILEAWKERCSAANL
jgi:hypothetical protein